MALPDNLLNVEVQHSRQKGKSLWILLIVAIIVVIAVLPFLFFQGTTTTGNIVVEQVQEEAVEPPSLADKEKYQLFAALLELEKTSPEEKIQFATVVTEIDGYVKKAQNPVLQKDWKRFIECYGEPCEREFDFTNVQLDVIEELFPIEEQESSFTKKVFKRGPKNSAFLLLRETLLLKKFVLTQDVVAMSRSVAYIQEQVVLINQPEITDKWNVLLNCDYRCDGYNEFLSVIVEFALGK